MRLLCNPHILLIAGGWQCGIAEMQMSAAVTCYVDLENVTDIADVKGLGEKVNNRKFCIVLCICIILNVFCVPSFAASENNSSFEEEMAIDLKALGILKGVSDEEFDLVRRPTRTEGIVMLIRLLGKEEAVTEGEWEHPFTDVPKWADKYVGYAYENGIANGITETEFGKRQLTASCYLTFMLRALGYSDKDGLDFNWRDPYTLARNVGILPDSVDISNFMRADAVSVSYAALQAKKKNSDSRLYMDLIAEGVFSLEKYNKTYSKKLLDSSRTATNNISYELKNLRYSWNDHRSSGSFDIEIPTALVKYYRSLYRDPAYRLSGYTNYIYEKHDDQYIADLADTFMTMAKNSGGGKNEAVWLAVSFVQSLNYIKDEARFGGDYPKYPIETLYDKGGDCEDTCILLAAILVKLGVGCCIIDFDDHMGVGIWCGQKMSGTYFESGGKKYYYVETTAKGWDAGEMPEVLKGVSARIWVI